MHKLGYRFTKYNIDNNFILDLSDELRNQKFIFRVPPKN